MISLDSFGAISYYRVVVGSHNKVRGSKYIIRGRKADGGEVFYTGRAGQEFIGPRSEAFGYEIREGAHRRATDLNRMVKLHGVWFIVQANVAA